MQRIDSKIKTDTVLFFDLDGTLVDTNLANFLSYRKAIQRVTNSDHDLTYNPGKRFNRSNLKIAVPNLREIEYAQIIKEKERCYVDFLPEIKLNKGIVDILFTYSKTNKTALVTNCLKGRAITTLDHFGLTDKFSTIVCRDVEDSDKKVNKFQNAITRLGVSPGLVVAFENEEVEIANAKRVGITVINLESI